MTDVVVVVVEVGGGGGDGGAHNTLLFGGFTPSLLYTSKKSQVSCRPIVCSFITFITAWDGHVVVGTTTKPGTGQH